MLSVLRHPKVERTKKTIFQALRNSLSHMSMSKQLRNLSLHHLRHRSLQHKHKNLGGLHCHSPVKKFHERLLPFNECWKTAQRSGALQVPCEALPHEPCTVKSCKACSKSVPSPPRARIAGLRASSFDDLIFVDHAEIKFGTSQYLVLLIIDGVTCSGLRPRQHWRYLKLLALLGCGQKRTTVCQRP